MRKRSHIASHRKRNARRNLLLAAAIGGTALLPLSGCGKKGEEKDVGAVEDLMREHGVLRRALLV